MYAKMQARSYSRGVILQLGDLVSYRGRLYYYQPTSDEMGYLFTKERHLLEPSKYTAHVQAAEVELLPQDTRFRVVRRNVLEPIDLLYKSDFSVYVQIRILYGKKLSPSLAGELKWAGVHRGLRRIYLAEMTFSHLSAKKIAVMRRLAEKSLKHKCFLIVTDAPTRSNYQADPRILAQALGYLGRHSHCAVFSWDRHPSTAQLSALFGMMADVVKNKVLTVPDGL